MNIKDINTSLLEKLLYLMILHVSPFQNRHIKLQSQISPISLVSNFSARNWYFMNCRGIALVWNVLMVVLNFCWIFMRIIKFVPLCYSTFVCMCLCLLVHVYVLSTTIYVHYLIACAQVVIISSDMLLTFSRSI